MRTALRAIARPASRAASLLLGATLTACAPPPGAGPGNTGQPRAAVSPAVAPSVAVSTPVPAGRIFRPAGRAAAHYASTPGRDLSGPPPDPLRTALIEEVRLAARRAGQPAPAPDPRLDWVMTDLARQVRGDDLPALGVVDFLLGHYGLPEPSPHVLLSRTSAGGEAEIRERVRGEIAAMLRGGAMGRIGVGVDRAGDTIYVALGLQERHLELRGPVARQLPAQGHAPIVAHLDAGYASPGLVITGPDGRVVELTPPLRNATLTGDIRCRGDGKHQVEITAVGPSGPAVLANFPVYCGVAPPVDSPGAAGAQPAAANPPEVEKAIVALIVRDRQRAGVGPVVVDERLAAVARAYSREMAEHDFVAHVSPRTGSAMDRAHAAGLAPELLMENVGRAYSADEAEAGFLSSPGHRSNVLDPRARRVGVGVAFGPPVTGTRPLYVTQLFTN